MHRHLERLREGAPRWLVVQLGGGVGTLVAYGDRRARGAPAASPTSSGLADPGISWLSARDRVAEFASVLTMVTGTLARIGGEVYELQRPEIGELGEPRADGVVGSITMHHKRNPEASEHLDTLARLTRANAGVLMESMVAQHERDGRAWKAEWVALPEVCLLDRRRRHTWPVRLAARPRGRCGPDGRQPREPTLGGTQFPTDAGGRAGA